MQLLKLHLSPPRDALHALIFCVSCILCLPTIRADDAETTRIRHKLESVPLSEKVGLSDEEWRKILTPARFFVLRKAGTEPAFQNEYANNHEKGVYACAACGNQVFGSETKFDSGTGWPSFYAPVQKEKVMVATDRTNGTPRQEVRCARCGSHLGHVFNDGPPPTRLRYCLNSAALKLRRSKD